ncbi:class I SAM-dependent methyltransferase [Ancylomarina longa]|uniref:Class I SAM-dependent methyltransferase n=1 Tax=Ancylomarina longa TaxID=2487017 RepID=A0A434AG64_9BACT|nr:class I SAM-dependent methyltransferase [Ancylomarina longa]RUT73361.1 class I SAM-dependent methyltransferase [Ancylomarina longa]
MIYDKTYSNTENVFGIHPETILEKYVHKLEKTRPVLDIGIGQGRNSFFLAKKGFQVDGIDLSEVAIESVLSISKKEKFQIKTYQKSFHEFVPKSTPYSAILVFGLIQILDWKSIHALIDRINQWTQKNSLVFITAFSIKDTSYKKYSKEWKAIGKNSFCDNNENYRTFLEPNEIVELFKNYNSIHHWEGLGPEHKHGDSPIEQHHLIELVLEKK